MRGEETTFSRQLRPGGHTLCPPHSRLLAYPTPRGLCRCLLPELQTPLDPSVLIPTLPASDLLSPEKMQLWAFPQHSDESQYSFVVTLKAGIVTFTGHHLIPSPYLNRVTMHNQPNIHYLGPDFSPVNKQLGRSKGAKTGGDEDWAGKRQRLCQSGQGK